jgi:hypothetical protein
MAFPPLPVDANVGGAISDPNEHPGHHNALAAAVNDIVDQMELEAINTRVECIWTGTAWTTNAGDAVPTSSSLIRTFNSQDDPDADTPPGPYNAYDIWHGVDA